MSENEHEKMVWACRDLIRKVIGQQYAGIEQTTEKVMSFCKHVNDQRMNQEWFFNNLIRRKSKRCLESSYQYLTVKRAFGGFVQSPGSFTE